MGIEPSPERESSRAAFRQFAAAEIAPHAERFDREERVPPEVIRRVAERGYLGSIIGPEWGGAGLDFVTYGLLNEEFGRACSSVRSLLTVHDMVSLAILKWGSAGQRQ